MGHLSHRDNAIFRNQKCNPVDVIRQVRNTYYYTLLYTKNINTINQDDYAGKRSQDKYKRNNVKPSILCQLAG